jgi:hypothetical protein
MRNLTTRAVKQSCWILLLLAGGCSEPSGPAVHPGQLYYTLTADGDAAQQKWYGTATIQDPRYLWLEMNSTSSAVSGNALWYFANSSPLPTLAGSHPVRARGVGSGDTVWVWWGHIVSDDPRTTGTVHLTRADSTRVEGTFTYRGLAGTGASQHFITIQGLFSAIRPN